MKKLFESHHPLRRAKSFHYAFKGIWHALLNEANFRIQIFIAINIIILGFYFKITTIEWGLLIISTGFLLSAEMVNTVIEEFIDHLIKEESEGARIIKDLGAGFVLVTALTVLTILNLIFWPRIAPLINL